MPSHESEYSMLDNNGSAESVQSPRALIAELRRGFVFWSERWKDTSAL